MAAGFGVVAGVAMVSQSEPVRAACADTVGPRICIFSLYIVLQQSVGGTTGSQRAQQLTPASHKTVAKRRQSLAKDIKAFNAKADTLKDDERQRQGRALQQRQRALKQHVQQLDARIRYTRSVVTKRINNEIDPLLDDSYENHG